jgi:AraC-like DNA-binding protein
LRFVNSLLPPEERQEAWRFALMQNSIDLLSFDGGKAHGELVSISSLHGIRFTRITASGEEIRLDHRKNVAAIWLCLVLSGEVALLDESERFGPGTLFFGGESATLHIKMDRAHELLIVHIPMPLLRNRLPAPLSERISLLLPNSPPATLLVDLLQSVAANLQQTSKAMLAPVEMVLPEFILAATLENAEARILGGAAGRRASFLEHVFRVIEIRLADPDLRVSDIAKQFRVSQRYIQKLFEGTGESFGSYVKSRRLEQCRADMMNPRLATKTISDILFQWGFNDSPSFSRAFRARYGTTPREFRSKVREEHKAESEAPKSDGIQHRPPEGAVRARRH